MSTIIVDNATKVVLAAGSDLTAAQLVTQAANWCYNYTYHASANVSRVDGVTLPAGFLVNKSTYNAGVWGSADANALAAINIEATRLTTVCSLVAGDITANASTYINGVSACSLTVAIKEVYMASSYEVAYQAQSGDTTWKFITVQDSGALTTDCVILGLKCNNVYNVKIRAITIWGGINWSTTVAKATSAELPDAISARLVVGFTKEAVVIPADLTGVVTSANCTAAGATSTLSIYDGTTNDISNWTVTQTRSAGLTVTEGLNSPIATVTDLSASYDAATITFRATRALFADIVRVFTITKSKTGQTGQTGTGTPGVPGKTYILSITGGKNGHIYDANGINPSPSPSAFGFTLTEDGVAVTPGTPTWSTGSGGLISGTIIANTFTPTLAATYDATKGNNVVFLSAVYAGKTISVSTSITCTKTGATGVGQTGPTGIKTSNARMYLWSSTPPVLYPSGTSTYTWADGSYLGASTPNSWSLTGGTAIVGATLYCVTVPVTSVTGTDTTSTITWNSATATVVGYYGTNGTTPVKNTDYFDGVSISLDNDSHGFPADSTGVAVVGSSVVNVVAYRGSIQLTTALGAATGLPTGMTAPATVGTGFNSYYTINVSTALAGDVGVVTLPITVAGVTYNKTFSWTKSKTGAQGVPGVAPSATVGPYLSRPIGVAGAFYYCNDTTGTNAGITYYCTSPGTWIKMAGDVFAENIAGTTITGKTIIGGTLRYGKTTGVDDTTDGYWLSSTGISVGNSSQYLKYTPAGGLTIVGTTISGSTIDNRGGGSVISNLALGSGTLAVNSSGTLNTAVGYKVLGANTTGLYNTGVGANSLFKNNTGYHNVAIGAASLYENLSGSFDIAIGTNALSANVSGVQNIAIGNNALIGNVSGNGNVAVGASALYCNLSDGNVAVGVSCLQQAVGMYNVAMGELAGESLASGNYNTLIGHYCGSIMSSGSNNTVIGARVVLPATLNDNIVIATGAGAIKAQHDGSRWVLGNTHVTQLNVSPSSGVYSATICGTAAPINGVGNPGDIYFQYTP